MLIAKDVVASHGNCSRREKPLLTRLFDEISVDPYKASPSGDVTVGSYGVEMSLKKTVPFVATTGAVTPLMPPG